MFKIEIKISIIIRYIFIFLIFFLSGCASRMCSDVDLTDKNNIIQQIDLQDTFDQIASKICEDRNSQNTFLVTDYVDIKTHKSGRSGMLMSELLRGSLNKKCNAKIVQADFGSSFRVGKDGIKVLTRKDGGLNKYDYNKLYAIVGTFNMSLGKLNIFTKKINVRNSKIVRQINDNISFSCFGGNITKIPF